MTTKELQGSRHDPNNAPQKPSVQEQLDLERERIRISRMYDGGTCMVTHARLRMSAGRSSHGRLDNGV